MEEAPTPFRVRFKVPLTVIPPVIGFVVGLLLWGNKAETDFFSAATHVLVIGAVGMALTGNFFRLAIHRDQGIRGFYTGLNVLGVLLATGLGLFFAFRALANGHAGEADLAITAGALATLVAAFAVQAIFGTPGLEQEDAGVDDAT